MNFFLQNACFLPEDVLLYIADKLLECEEHDDITLFWTNNLTHSIDELKVSTTDNKSELSLCWNKVVYFYHVCVASHFLLISISLLVRYFFLGKSLLL